MHLTSEEVNMFAEGQIEILGPKGHRRGSIERISIPASDPILFVYLYWEAEEHDGKWSAINTEHIAHEHKYEFDLTPFEIMEKNDLIILYCKQNDTKIILHPPYGDLIDPARVDGTSPG